MRRGLVGGGVGRPSAGFMSSLASALGARGLQGSLEHSERDSADTAAAAPPRSQKQLARPALRCFSVVCFKFTCVEKSTVALGEHSRGPAGLGFGVFSMALV